jgi:hypothetical protein
VLPIDGEKVKEVLNALRDLQTHRYVNYTASSADLQKYSLPDNAAHQISLVVSGKPRVKLLVSSQGPDNDPDDSHYATTGDQGMVFLLKGEQIEKLDKDLEFFEKKD